MGAYNPYDQFGICFNMLKMKYADYDESLTSKDLLQKYDKLNVFINLETPFKYISTIKDLEKKVVMQRDFDILMISHILNLVAHYKRFFVNNTFDTKVYIYNTDFNSYEFTQFKYNEDFRSYYLTKFNDNPKFALFTERLKNNILPAVKTYCEFIPNVYYVSAKNIEGSLVPYIIANNDKTRKNVIIGGEFYDTQYAVLPNFINHYFHRSIGANSIYSDISGFLHGMTKNVSDCNYDELNDTYKSYTNYCMLLSVVGDKQRSIDGIYGCGVMTLQKYLEAGKQQHIIQDETTNPELLGDIFHDGEIKKEFISNYYCSSILNMYDELTEAEKDCILNQILIDRDDKNSFARLNQTKFYGHELILEGLLI